MPCVKSRDGGCKEYDMKKSVCGGDADDYSSEALVEVGIE